MCSTGWFILCVVMGCRRNGIIVLCVRGGYTNVMWDVWYKCGWDGVGGVGSFILGLVIGGREW